MTDRLTRIDLLIIDELGYVPFAQSGGQLLFHLINQLYERLNQPGRLNLNLSPPLR